ncbi:histidine kinase [Cellulomonas sp. SG140]|uniref:histidine kinase n=1 Tax=Cellulomonas sp. SG140 TaxID=2976536 RepID=UPI0021E75E4C|nr:histidine kinase [Cellulomonas sp. SG140]
MPDPQPTPEPDDAAVPDVAATPPDTATPPADNAEPPVETAEPTDSGAPAEPADTLAPPDSGDLAADAPVPTEDELLRTAVPATVRHAPRYSAFLTAGTLVGLVVGLLVAVLLGDGSVSSAGGVLPFLGGSSGVRLLSALTGAVLGLGIGAGLALWADRRSLRR